MNTEANKLRIPAIRSGMGIWNYYVSSMTFSQVAHFVKMPDEIYKSRKLSEMMQRSLTDNVKAIVEYIKCEKERFFNALVLAVYNGEPQWHEGVFEYEEENFYTIGVLEFDENVRIFPVDGQHRLAAIKKVVEDGKDSVNQEEVPVIFIAHRNDDEGIKRTRRLFTTLNRYARPVKLNEIIALDEDDIVAIVTRRLVEDATIFSDDKINTNKTESIPDTDQTAFTNIITLYNCNDILLGCFLGNRNNTKHKEYKRFRKPDNDIEKFYGFVFQFWKEFVLCHHDIRAFFKGKYMGEIRGKQGGNLLFRPVGLRAYIDAVGEIYSKKTYDFKQIFLKYKDINFALEKTPWKGIIWDGKMKPANRNIAKEIFLYLFDDNILSSEKKKNLIERYADIKGLSLEQDKEQIIKELTIL